MEWQRARSTEQKEQRISDIIEVTARLYEKHTFEKITLVMIAKELSFSRTSMYKYFKSLEEIFLVLFEQYLIAWRKDLLETFAKHQDYTVEDFASIWVQFQSRHERMLNLISILPKFLEKNISLERLILFKRNIKAEYVIIIDLFCRLFPSLGRGNAFKFYKIQLATLTGLYHMANLSDRQQEVGEYPEFAEFNVDFYLYFRDAVVHLLNGLLNEVAMQQKN